MTPDRGPDGIDDPSFTDSQGVSLPNRGSRVAAHPAARTRIHARSRGFLRRLGRCEEPGPFPRIEVGGDPQRSVGRSACTVWETLYLSVDAHPAEEGPHDLVASSTASLCLGVARPRRASGDWARPGHGLPGPAHGDRRVRLGTLYRAKPRGGLRDGCALRRPGHGHARRTGGRRGAHRGRARGFTSAGLHAREPESIFGRRADRARHGWHLHAPRVRDRGRYARRRLRYEGVREDRLGHEERDARARRGTRRRSRDRGGHGRRRHRGRGRRRVRQAPDADDGGSGQRRVRDRSGGPGRHVGGPRSRRRGRRHHRDELGRGGSYDSSRIPSSRRSC